MFINRGQKISGAPREILSAPYKKKSVGAIMGIVKQSAAAQKLLTSRAASLVARRFVTGQDKLGISRKKERLLMKDLADKGVVKPILRASPFRAMGVYHREAAAQAAVQRVPVSSESASSEKRPSLGARRWREAREDAGSKREDHQAEERRHTTNFGRQTAESAKVSAAQAFQKPSTTSIERALDTPYRPPDEPAADVEATPENTTPTPVTQLE
ncbi:MAG: hypothetical protein UY92_C0002G0014 [Candidatus Magasanikbacteria bacterium GW2011_GWA2_56_11]|uniref:Uncharacterized protein n=1 Tax=Candidatus Magasanikbacteria bacterium GW2011_GWA2_56_11 TaxID=1619044 RepID=A0A0G2ANH3_9BACT|nr:MAG: hypothetical protein UY92_C0002G0014 [Candidatus Magasanikbacteria bacterium GW2011_GWA2_56_11]